MKELHLTMRLRNNRIRRQREDLGLSPRQLSEQSGVSYSRVLEYEGMRHSPVGKDGNWLPSALLLAQFFGCEPAHLFPDVVLAVQNPELAAEVDGQEALALAKMAATPVELPPSPAECIEHAELVQAVDDVMATLKPREREVLKRRFGLGGVGDMTLEEIGLEFEVNRERIRQIEQKALMKLRHPWRSRLFKEYLDADSEPMRVQGPCLARPGDPEKVFTEEEKRLAAEVASMRNPSTPPPRKVKPVPTTPAEPRSRTLKPLGDWRRSLANCKTLEEARSLYIRVLTEAHQNDREDVVDELNQAYGDIVNRLEDM